MNDKGSKDNAGRPVQIQTRSVTLEGNLSLPESASGIVLFVHGSGSSRHSPRNRYVAKMMQEGGLGTLLFDLLTPEEEQEDLVTRHIRFDIGLLASRTSEATAWLKQETGRDLNVGYFGSSTGAAAALIAASEDRSGVGAVVSRGGRPDLASAALADVRVPVLLIVGEKDYPVIELNEQAANLLPQETDVKIEIVPGATHLFEEPGTLEKAAGLARYWFKKYLN
jgi:putative phosphoribosyl transferase